jgi:sec-independent protein translocase protein TatA
MAMELVLGFLSLPGGSEWIFILLVLLFLFGGKNALNAAKTIGRGIREFTAARRNLPRAIEEQVSDVLDNKASRAQPRSRGNHRKVADKRASPSVRPK